MSAGGGGTRGPAAHLGAAGHASEHRVLEAMACGVGLADVLLAITALVEHRTGGTCRIELGEVVAPAAGTRSTCSAAVSLGGEPVARVTAELHAAPDEEVADVVARAAVLTGMALAAHRRSEALSYGATHDPLTGLPNRTLLLDRLGHAVAASRRREGRVALLYLDLDHFKEINDRLGHRAGDGVLAEVGRRLAGCIREGDTASRLGGDEFAVLLDATDEETVTSVVRRVQASLDAPMSVAGQAVSVRASIGVALAEGHSSADDLLDRADSAMYRSKRAGRGAARPALTRADAPSAGRDPIGSDLAGALARRELRLHYQPLLALRSGRVVGFEALLRWSRPGQGIVEPASFLRAAEDLGLLCAIGAWVLEEACRQLARWRRSPGAGHLRMAVNLSARQLVRSDLEGSVVAALSEAGLAPGDLTLEFADGDVLRQGPDALDNLHRLRALGAVLALDDFGCGGSSLRELRDLPVHQVKVDRRFVREAGAGGTDGAFTSAIVRLGVELGLQAVGEGIERPRQLAALRDAGCSLGQGYLFARPLPAPELDVLLRSPDALSGAGLRL